MNDLIAKLRPSMQLRSFLAGEVIAVDLAQFDGIIAVHEGLCLVETSRETAKAKGKHDVSVGTLKPVESLIGLEFFFTSPHVKYRASVRAVTDAKVYTISRPKLATLLEGTMKTAKPYIIEEMARLLAEYHNALQLQLERQAQYAPEDRVASVFEQVKNLLGEPHPSGVEIRIPTYVLQRLSGDSERSFQEGTRRLMKAGKLLKSGRAVWVLPH